MSPELRLRRGHLGRQAVEHRVQLGAESAGADDDGDGNEGGDEAVFDGRGARLVLGKAVQKGLHGMQLLLSLWRFPGSGAPRLLPRAVTERESSANVLKAG